MSPDMNADIRGIVNHRRRANRALVERMFGAEPLRDDLGRFVPDDVPEDRLADVARLQELREHAEAHADREWVASVDARLRESSSTRSYAADAIAEVVRTAWFGAADGLTAVRGSDEGAQPGAATKRQP
jgi:hypothetical protein